MPALHAPSYLPPRDIYKSGEFAFSTSGKSRIHFHKTMKITIHNGTNDEDYVIEIPEDFKLSDLKAYVAAETDSVPSNMVLVHNNVVLEGSNKELKNLGIEDNDILVLRPSDMQASTVTNPESSVSDRIELYRQEVLNNPQLNSQFQTMYPQLMGTLNDPERFRTSFYELMMSQQSAQSHEARRRQEEWNRVQQNPDDPENQAKILEMIRQEQIDENFKLAHEISPESFVTVHLLQIKLKINGHETHALVDSGAQITIIHPKLAEEFGILHLIDKSWARQVSGVGSALTKGRIHSVRVSLGESDIELPCSFTVLETDLGVVFGLDMLKRHKCSINLAKDALEIGGMEIRFLNEAEIEKNVKSYRPNDISDSITSESGKDEGISTAQTIPSNPLLSSTRPSTTADNFPEDNINQLMSLGFTRDEAIAALRGTNGNVELAASLLFN